MITLRKATMDDRDLLLVWRNSYKPVDVEEHTLWMSGWMAIMALDETQGLFVAECDGMPVGTGRIEDTKSLGVCVIHYFIAEEQRWKGYGTQLVRALTDQAEAWGYDNIVAQIVRGHRASLYCAMEGGATSVEFL